MANQTGIAIVIKAFLPTGKTLDEQFNALSIVKDAHATGDYSGLLKAANVDSVLTEQKTRRIEDQPQGGETAGQTASEVGGEQPATETATQAGRPATEQTKGPEAEPVADTDVPEFLKKDKKSKAA